MLKLIASHDSLIKMCGTDVEVAKKFSSTFTDWQTTFDPIISLASNPEFLVKGFDFWSTPKGKMTKRKFGTFDENKYTRFFISRRKEFLEQEKEQYDLKRDGFDCYAYLMTYENEIMQMYSKREDLSKLQKAALHYVEIGLEPKEVDYLRYLASYDDLVANSVAGKPAEQTWEQWLPAIGKLHYENGGRVEIHAGVRPVEIFDPMLYIASYPHVQADFKTEDGFDHDKLAIAYITVGSVHGFVRNQFNPFAFIANALETLDEDIFTNGEVDVKKVVPIWLQKIADNAVDLTKFNAEEYKQLKELGDDVDVFAEYVKEQIALVKKSKKTLMMLCGKLVSCVSMPKVSVPSPKVPEMQCLTMRKKEKKEEKKEDDVEIVVEN